MSTFVSVGNATQSFDRLLAEIVNIASNLPGPIVVQHGHTPFTCAACDVHAFVDMRTFETLIMASKVLVIHAGAGSIVTALRLGRRPIVVPRRAEYGEHVNDHQIELARQVARTGRILLVEDIADLRGAIDKVKTLATLPESALVSPSPLIGAISEALAGYCSDRPDPAN